MTIEPDVDLVFCLASGFGNRAYSRSDIRSIYRELRQLYISPTTEFHYGVWNGQWKDTAERLHQVATRHARCVFVAHSWGCGHAYKVFERAWGKCGRSIDLAVLIDPVPRPFRLFVPGNLWAMTTWGKVKVKNAREVLAFRQTNGRPMGRRVVDGMETYIQRLAFGSKANLDKYAPRAIEPNRVYDETMHHESIDADERVQSRIFTEIASKVVAWREGK
jgi:pimeloyl-ACP methyl ester carboxylesterase